jgi:hypothetical protein
VRGIHYSLQNFDDLSDNKRLDEPSKTTNPICLGCSEVPREGAKPVEHSTSARTNGQAEETGGDSAPRLSIFNIAYYETSSPPVAP